MVEDIKSRWTSSLPMNPPYGVAGLGRHPLDTQFLTRTTSLTHGP